MAYGTIDTKPQVHQEADGLVPAILGPIRDQISLNLGPNYSLVGRSDGKIV
jgi:hypothetical protein